MSNTHANVGRLVRTRDLPLDLLRGFEAAARHLSFTKAAEELFLTQSAISRQVQGLEEALGVPLFQRRHRALLLTDAGQLLHRTVARQLAELRDVVQRIAGGSRVLTVTTLVSFASLWLVPRLAKFRKAHPDIDVRIAANNEIVDLERDRIDVAIRYVSPDRVPAGTRQLFGEEVVPVCAPALLRDPKRPLREPADLARHVLLHDDPGGTKFGPAPYLQWDVWLEALGLPDLQAAGAVHFSHYDQLIQAAIEGEGVALGRMPLVSQQIRQGKLVTPFERARGKAPRATRAYFVLASPSALVRPEVRQFIDWLMEEGAVTAG